MKKEQFSKLRKLNKDDKILLLTHTDMDGSTKIVMDQMFDNVDVWHCNNNAMSYLIKKAVTTEVADEYDAIVVTDISCNKEDAEIINNSPNKNKLTLLDHHPTATHLNQYPWAVVEVNVVEDSFRMEAYKGLEGGHSSGTSLLYDFLEYQGHTDRVAHLDLLKTYVDNVARYDTWDWHDLFNEKPFPKMLDELSDTYGLAMFERIMTDRIKNGENLTNEVDEALLQSFKEKEKTYVDEKKDKFEVGNITIGGTSYSFVLSVSDDYLGAILDEMKDEYPDADLYMVDYGTGISLRTTKESIHVGQLVAPFGGGGHAGAGGIRVTMENQVKKIEGALNTEIFVDKGDLAFKVPADYKEKEVDTDVYKDMEPLEALKAEIEQRKENGYVYNATKKMVTAIDYKTFEKYVIAFASKYTYNIMEEMKALVPDADKYIVASEEGVWVKSDATLFHEYNKDDILNTISDTFGNASLSMEEEERER